MANTPNPKAPYAPPQAVVTVIDRVRKGLTGPITSDTLLRAGIAESLVPRTLQSLQMLNLIDANGKPTTVLEGLQRSGEAELPGRLTDWLNEVYADVLRFVDPATATEGAIRDAFRSYDPVGQQPRMVSLFVGLYRQAGLRAPGRAAPTKSGTPTRQRATTPKPKVSTSKSGKAGRKPRGEGETDGMPPALSGLLESLPLDGNGWTQEARDRFVTTFSAVLDFCFPIVEEADLEPELEEVE